MEKNTEKHRIRLKTAELFILSSHGMTYDIPPHLFILHLNILHSLGADFSRKFSKKIDGPYFDYMIEKIQERAAAGTYPVNRFDMRHLLDLSEITTPLERDIPFDSFLRNINPRALYTPYEKEALEGAVYAYRKQGPKSPSKKITALSEALALAKQWERELYG